MPQISLKPLRKPEALILTDEDIAVKDATRKASAQILQARALPGRFAAFELMKSESDLFPAGALLTSATHVGDYVCNLRSTAIVSDEAGRVADILLTVPPFRGPGGIVVDPSDERHLRTLIGLLHAADGNRHFTMLCHPQQLGVVESWFTHLGLPRTMYSLNISTFYYSIWAQDAYVALTDQSGQPLLCESVHFPRVDDATIADVFSAQTNKSALQSYLYFQGGNVLEVGPYVLIGKDYIEENLGRAFLETEGKILQAFEEVFGKPVIPVGRPTIIPEAHRRVLGGGLYQPIFHIDMYITPTGKKAANGKDIVAVASPRLGRAAVGEHPKASDHDVYFDEAATQLAAHFEVVRTPLLPAFVRQRTPDGLIERHYYLSFNNAIVENYAGHSNVYLPTFSQDVSTYATDPDVLYYEGTMAQREALDLAAKTAWEQLGFTVHQMDGLEDLAIGWGSVHCITKTVVRA
jgi:hypothetical protein